MQPKYQILYRIVDHNTWYQWTSQGYTCLLEAEKYRRVLSSWEPGYRFTIMAKYE